MLKLKVVLADPNARMPVYKTGGAAGMDLAACHGGLIRPGERVLVRTGIKIALPPGIEGQVRPRSGLALRWGVTVLNAPGTIDSDFTDEIGVLLINHGTNPFFYDAGDRIAQLVLASVKVATLEVVNEITETGRGGFGHTGVK
jgi:dUTP pyrophosphatase